jgi:hypothetical protein
VRELVEAWEKLRAEGRTEAGWHVRRIHASAPCELLAGILQPGATPGLLLELSTGDIPNGLTLPRSQGFTVEPVAIRHGPFGRVRFALALAEPAYQAVFTVLSDDAAAMASAELNPRDALRSWIGRLHVWQEFMARHGVGELSEEAAVGLFGELWFLREELAPVLGLGSSIDAWAGPRGEPSDFAITGGFVEVKSTLQQAPTRISISNLEQLDDGRGAILLLHLLLRNDSNGESLAQLVSSLRAELARTSADRLRLFNDLLLASGYIDMKCQVAEQRRAVHRTDIYRITAAFPRVRRTDVRPGVLTCRYTIDMALCAPFLVNEQALTDLLRSKNHA